MKTYFLKATADADGQPIAMFHRAQNSDKAIDQLAGICTGILADGIVTEDEAIFFAEWVQKYKDFEPIWPFSDILARVERIFSDGICDDDEREELKDVMEAICGHTNQTEPAETYSTKLPLDSPMPDPIIFLDRHFTITGKFAFGSRNKVVAAIEEKGGVPSTTSPTKGTHYLLIGTFSSRDWATSTYGRKIERAIELRESNSGIAIISEEHWKKFLL